jgi:hypothetical protein
MTAGSTLLFFLPFLLSLVGKAPMPRVLCLISSAMAMLLSVQPGGAVLPWGLVVRFQHSHPIAAGTFANVGIKGPLAKH